MKLIIKPVLLIFSLISLLLAGSFLSCEKNDGMENIEDLYAQPLPVIQKCVQGKWSCYMSNGIGALGPITVTVEITKTSATVLDYYGRIYEKFNYQWEQKETPLGYTTYIMWDTVRNIGRWYFESIRNDSLLISEYNTSIRNVFVRIK
jgi:hypothetical protein